MVLIYCKQVCYVVINISTSFIPSNCVYYKSTSVLLMIYEICSTILTVAYLDRSENKTNTLIKSMYIHSINYSSRTYKLHFFTECMVTKMQSCRYLSKQLTKNIVVGLPKVSIRFLLYFVFKWYAKMTWKLDISEIIKVIKKKLFRKSSYS